MSNYKALFADYQAMQLHDGTTDEYYRLTRRQVNAILTQISYLRWRTRWVNSPNEFDTNKFVGDIEDRLMTPEVIGMIDCNEVENCIVTSPTIASILNSISVNSSNISNLDDNISSIASIVSDNASSIVNMITLIDDHEQRITTLENTVPSSEGLFTEISHQILDSDGLFQDVNVSEYRYWRAVIVALGNSTSGTYLYVQTSPNNMTDSLTVNNQPAISILNYQSSANFGRWTQAFVECPNSNDDGKGKSLNISSNNPVGGGLEPSHSNNNTITFAQGAIETVNFIPNVGQLLAGSTLTIYGIKDTSNDIPNLPPLPTGDVRVIVNFDDGYEDYELPLAVPPNEVPSIDNSGLNGNCILTTSSGDVGLANGLTVNLPAGATVKFVRCDFRCDVSNPNAIVSYQNRVILKELDSSGVAVQTIDDTGGIAIDSEQWKTYQWTGSHQMRYVGLSVGISSTPNDGIAVYENRIDNIVIDYTP